MASYGPERERANLLDIERREQYVSTVFLRAAQLSVAVAGTDMFMDPVDVSSSSTALVPLNPLTHIKARDSLTTLTRLNEVEVETETDVASIDLSTSLTSLAINIPPLPRISVTNRDRERERDTSPSLGLDSTVTAAAATAAALAIDDLSYILIDEDDMRYQSTAVNESELACTEQIEPLDKDGCGTLSVLFDGDNRALCNFQIKLSSSTLTNVLQSKSNINSNSNSKGSSKGEVSEVSDIDAWIADNLVSARASTSTSASASANVTGSLDSCDTDTPWYPLSNGIHLNNGETPHVSTNIEDLTNTKSKNPHSADIVELQDVTMVAEDESVWLARKSVCPKIEDDVICRMMHVDKLAYTGV